MQVIVVDDDVEIFTFDAAEDHDEYVSMLPPDQETAIIKALTEALRFVLHLQQPKAD